MRGVPVHAIQALLGHSSVTTTMRYVHVNWASMAEAGAKLDRIVSFKLTNSAETAASS